MIEYKTDGRDPLKGLDCWGFVAAYFRSIGITLYDPAIDPKKADAQWEDVEKGHEQERDVVVISKGKDKIANHVGILWANGVVIHMGAKGVEATSIKKLNVKAIHRCR